MSVFSFGTAGIGTLGSEFTFGGANTAPMAGKSQCHQLQIKLLKFDNLLHKMEWKESQELTQVSFEIF